jgi:hypothetical protein
MTNEERDIMVRSALEAQEKISFEKYQSLLTTPVTTTTDNTVNSFALARQAALDLHASIISTWSHVSVGSRKTLQLRIRSDWKLKQKRKQLAVISECSTLLSTIGPAPIKSEEPPTPSQKATPGIVPSTPTQSSRSAAGTFPGTPMQSTVKDAPSTPSKSTASAYTDILALKNSLDKTYGTYQREVANVLSKNNMTASNIATEEIFHTYLHSHIVAILKAADDWVLDFNNNTEALQKQLSEAVIQRSFLTVIIIYLLIYLCNVIIICYVVMSRAKKRR